MGESLCVLAGEGAQDRSRDAGEGEREGGREGQKEGERDIKRHFPLSKFACAGVPNSNVTQKAIRTVEVMAAAITRAAATGPWAHPGRGGVALGPAVARIGWPMQGPCATGRPAVI